MSNKRLVSYIKEQTQAGYNISTIRDYLVKYGYTYKDIDEALQEVYHPDVKHVVHHLSNKTLVAVAVISIIIVLLIPTIYYYISDSSVPQQLLDIRTSSLKNNVRPGDKIEFNIELSNQGKGKRFDVLVRHEVVGTEIFKEETIAVETSTSKTSYVQLPDDIAARKYTLRTIASYNEKKAVSTFGFNVLAAIDTSAITKPSTEKCIERWDCGEWQPSVCPSSFKQTRICTDLNKCSTTLDKPETTRSCNYQAEETEQHETITSDSGLTIWQRLDLIKEKAKTDPSGASIECGLMEIETHRDECYSGVAEVSINIEYCEKIVGERSKDKCFSEIAKLTNDNALCEKIAKTTRKDSCYMNFVNNKDYTVCDKIDNSYLKEACVALRDMPDIVVS